MSNGGFDEAKAVSLLSSMINMNGTCMPAESSDQLLAATTPKGSEQPLVYFDTSRHKPYQYDPYAARPNGATTIFRAQEAP